MTYEDHHAALVAYLRVKVEAHDWHGVSDAANDLRVLEAQPRERTTQQTIGNWDQATPRTIRPNAMPERVT